MVLNIDVAPTILDLAGVEIPSHIQGRSLRPLLAGQEPKAWRTSFLYEYFREDWLPGIPTILAVRTTEWKYTHFPEIEDVEELYDLAADPREMHNLARAPGSAPNLADLRAELERLLKETGYTPSW